MPNEEGASLPAPYIDYTCNPVDSPCADDVYPFICVSQDATGPGDEVTTVRSLIPGTYEYWIELYQSSPEGDLEVTLRNKGGNFIRSWISPANPNAASQIGWHVFDINGKTRSILSVDETIADSMPSGAHDPNTDVCPTI